ncbi:MAG: hypothetical protein GY855_15790 [candidate division Zixibacteria bacterium]|nr:hypothetical protein [candidate division Zixibacteria bacterium]
MESNRSNLSRRKFISSSIVSVASAGFIGIAPQIAFAKEKKNKNIIYRKLGKTGLKLPIVSMGVMNANNPEIVQASYELGVRHFDTAARYQFGRNEQIVGNVIKRLGVRDDVIIGTKVLRPAQREGLNSEQFKTKLIELCDGSLKRLRSDYIDILYIHSVSEPNDVNEPGIIEGMKELKKQGKIRYSGITSHGAMADVINEMAKTNNYDVVLTAINVTMKDDTALLDAIKNAKSKGIGVIAMKTQAGGQRLPNQESLQAYRSSIIATASLKWVMRNENIATAIPGYTNFDHMKEDFSVAFDLDYTTEEESFLSDNNIKLGMGFCKQCKLCMASCPNGVDVPSLMRTHMYSTQYCNFHLARDVLNDIPQAKGIQTCGTCNSCTAKCVNYVDIGKKIEELKLIYT